MKKIVSILTPCYNTGKYVARLLESVLLQTYPFVEMIVIDDGSTDNTRDIVTDYIVRFEARGYSLYYIYQENQGQSVAINNGLKLVKGDFLAWPDSDDFYTTNDAIEKMVNHLDSLPKEFALVRCKMQILDEDTFKVIGSRGEGTLKEEKWELFEDCLRGNFYFYPGCYMLRFSSFLDVNGLDIYTEKDAGQNWQIFLPVLYRFRCSTINEYLFSVLARSSSHSRGQYEGIERTIQKWDAYERTIIATLDKINSMPINDKNDYKREVQIQYALRKYDLAVENRHFSFMSKYRVVLEKLCSFHMKEKIKFYSAYIPGLVDFITRINIIIKKIFN